MDMNKMDRIKIDDLEAAARHLCRDRLKRRARLRDFVNKGKCRPDGSRGQRPAS